METIKEWQEVDPYLNKVKKEIEEGKRIDFEISDLVKFSGRIFIPGNKEIKKLVTIEAHATPYTVDPGSTKMYQDLKPGKKKDIA